MLSNKIKMPNPNMPSQESLEAMQGLHDPTAMEIAAMNEAARDQLNGYDQQLNAMLRPNGADVEVQPDVDPVSEESVTLNEVEHRVDHDFDVQVGAQNQLLDKNAQQLPKTKEQQEGLAFRLEELTGNVGDDTRIDQTSKGVQAHLEATLKKFDIEPTNVGQGKEAVVKTLIAENVVNMDRAGGSKELDPTRAEQLERITRQAVGQEAITHYDKNFAELGELYKDQPLTAIGIAKAVALYRQNGSVNYRTSQALGRNMQASQAGNEEFALAA